MRTSAAALLLALAVLAGFAISGCGDGGYGSDNEGSPTAAAAESAYLEEIAAALQNVNTQLDGLEELRAEAFDSGASPESAAAYGAAFKTYNSNRLAAVEALTPGKGLQDQHAAIVSAARDNVAFAEELAAALAASPPASQTEFLDLFGQLDVVTITGRFRDACSVLQVQATAAGLDADLECLR